MPIKEGDRVPHATLKMMTDGGIKDVTTEELFTGRKVVVFGLPGAFTPTCSSKHLPGFLDKADEIKARGVDDIACVSVNDAFVMDAWAKDRQCDNKVLMLADGSRDFTHKTDLEWDATDRGMGIRSKRYAMIVDDGVVTKISIDQPGVFEESSAEMILKSL